MNKKEIRSYIKELKSNLTEEQIQNNSHIIMEQLLKEPAFLNCNELFCYVSFNQEVLTRAIIQTAMARNIKTAVPRIVDSQMKFYYIHSLEELQPGTMGILEPVTGNEAIPGKEQNNLIIVPGLAFDENKNRIGYGGGYYDRFFEKYSDIPMTKVALAFDFQILNELPAEENDKKVDKIITELQIIM